LENQSVVRRSKLEKLRASAARFAISIAKERKDPMYTKYHKLRGKFVGMKKGIFRKYRAEAIKRSRAAMMNPANKK